jgi:putative phosphoribosyl transferase
VVAVEFPEPFIAVGLWYERFAQTSDEEVLECLRRGRRVSRVEAEEIWNGEWIGPERGDPPAGPEEETLAIPFDSSASVRRPRRGSVHPVGAKGLVMFVHGSGSTRRSPRNRFVAGVMQRAGSRRSSSTSHARQAVEDEVTTQLRFDIDLLTSRVLAATRWVSALPRTRGLRLGYFGASTGAAAALTAAARMPESVAAVVSRGGRPDLVPPATLQRVRAPVLLVVGSRDEQVLLLYRSVLRHLASAELSIVPGAAVSWVKIDGVRSADAKIPGAKESTADVLLNLKKLAIQVPSGLTSR